MPRSPAAAEPSLRASVRPIGDVDVVAPAGRLDETFERSLTKVFETLCESRRHRVVVDLAGLTYLNSRGVSIFIAAVDGLRAAGGDLKLVGGPPQARLVLERLGVDRLLQHYDTVDQAVEAFQVPIQEFLSQGGLEVFVAAARGRTFHASSCGAVDRLKSVRILPSKKAARDFGLRPCARCCRA